MVRFVRLVVVMLTLVGLFAASLNTTSAQDPVASPVVESPVQPTATNVSTDESTATATAESSFSAAAAPMITILTSDGSSIPTGTRVDVFQLTGALPQPPYGYDFESAAPSGTEISGGIWIDNGAVLQVTVVAPGFDNFVLPFAAGTSPTITLQVVTSTTIELTIDTFDASDIPAGTEWSLSATDWTPVASGTFDTAASAPQSITLPSQVLLGTYFLVVRTPGDIFFYNQTVLVNQAPSQSFTVVITNTDVPSVGPTSVELTIATFDGSDIPAGTQWSLSASDWTPLASGTFDSATTAPQTITLPDPVPFGTYNLVVRTEGDIFFYNASVQVNQEPTQTFAVVITNTDTPEGNEATVDLTISTDDGSNIPAGTTWMLTLADEDYTPVQSGSVAPGSTSPFNVVLPSPVPWGQYVFFAVTPENVYYGGQVVNIFQDSFSYSFEFVHLQGDVSATVSTGDAAEVPAGTTWSITDADSTVIQSGTFAAAVPSGSALPLTNPIDYGVYSVVITAPAGYLPFTTSITVNQPTSAFDFTLQPPAPVTGTVDLVVTTSDGGEIPTGTIITIGGVSYTVPASDASAAAIASGTTIPFTDVPEGVQTLTVSNASPYLDLTDSVDIVAGETLDAAIELQLAPVPTPDPQGTVTPGDPQTPVPTAEPTDEAPDTGTVVTTLPSTGQGSGSSSTQPLILLAVAAMLIVGGSVIAKRRTSL